MEFKIIYLNKIIILCFFDETALYLACLKENVEIVKLLLANDQIDVNVLNILFCLLIIFWFFFYHV